ncbi:MAG: Maf family protein, partial [Oscillospiraceae bacterium]|nr:Maf family protein [Oscillospiraceae bacterium]
ACVGRAEVTFRALGEDEIAAYVAGGEPMDKAGAYGIQGRAAAFVEEIRGDYYSVVGLPVCRLAEFLRELAPEAEIRPGRG